MGVPTTRPSCPCKRLPLVLSSYTAAEHGDVHSLQRRHQRQGNARSNHQDDTTGGITPLHLAAQHGHVAATAFLLQRQTSPNPGKDGATPLHRASYSGASTTMRLLLEHARKEDRVASRTSPSKLQEALLARDTSFGDKRTPLHKAAAGGRFLAVQLLLETAAAGDEGQGTSDRDNDETPMHYGSLLAQVLTARDASNMTALEVALHEQQIEAQERQINNGELAVTQHQQSVARWNNVAGGPPNWATCVDLLKFAHGKLIDFQQDRKATPSMLTLTTTKELPAALVAPSSSGSAEECIDCSSGYCVTSTWERQFFQALSQSVDTTLSQNDEKDRLDEMEGDSSSQVSSVNSQPILSNGIKPAGGRPTQVDMVSPASQSDSSSACLVDTNQATPVQASVTMGTVPGKVASCDRGDLQPPVGRTCNACHKTTFALFRLEGDDVILVCKRCRRNRRRTLESLCR